MAVIGRRAFCCLAPSSATGALTFALVGGKNGFAQQVGPKSEQVKKIYGGTLELGHKFTLTGLSSMMAEGATFPIGNHHNQHRSFFSSEIEFCIKSVRRGSSSAHCSPRRTMLASSDVTKTRLQLQGQAGYTGKETLGFRGMFITIIRTEGAAGMFAGVKPAIARHVPYTGFRAIGYEHIRGVFCGSVNGAAKPRTPRNYAPDRGCVRAHRSTGLRAECFFSRLPVPGAQGPGAVMGTHGQRRIRGGHRPGHRRPARPHQGATQGMRYGTRDLRRMACDRVELGGPLLRLSCHLPVLSCLCCRCA